MRLVDYWFLLYCLYTRMRFMYYGNCFAAIVVHEADKLSTDAQHYIRWILEKYRGCNKIFFCCYDASKLQTIKYLCKIVKLHQPSTSEVIYYTCFSHQ